MLAGVKGMKELSVQVEEELIALRARVDHRREYLNILEIELFNTRASLQEFTMIYGARISPFENEEQRLKTLLEEAITQKMASNDQPPRQREPRGAGQATEGNENHRNARKLPSAQNPDFERKIRELFRNLAKRFHPDLAFDPEEKKNREQIMAQVNQAYGARDLQTLEKLASQAAPSNNGHSSGAKAEVIRLKVELRHLEAMIFEVEHTIRELDLSPAMQLRTEVNIERQAGRDLLADIEINLKERIAHLREDLLDLGVDARLVDA